LETQKHCPICGRADVEFGVCRSRSDGRNLYCKGCIRDKVTEGRKRKREWKAARGPRLLAPSLPFGPPELVVPVDRVREAIQRGARTQKQIRTATRFGVDLIGECLAELLLWRREVSSELKDGHRHYFMNNAGAVPLRSSAGYSLPDRKPDVASFSVASGLMPGERRKAG